MPEKKDLKNIQQLIVLLIFAIIGFVSWFQYPRAFIWDDSYFYLVIARNIVINGSQTFSNLYITNGIHPLWLYLLTGYSYIVSAIDSNLLSNPSYALPLSILLVLVGSLNLWKVASLLRLSRLLLVGLPLCYVLFFQVLYSEAHVYYAALSWLTLLMVKNVTVRPQSPYVIGLVCAMVFLGRLDSVFLVLCFLGWYLYSNRSSSIVFRTFVPLVFLLLPYLLSNYYYFGGFTPVSGWLKSSFPHIFLNKSIGLNSFFGYNLVAGVVPIIVGLLIFLIIKFRGPVRNLIKVLLVGSILHFVYTAFFTRFHTMYWWYYIPHILLLSCSVAAFYKRYRLPRFLRIICVIVLVLLFGYASVSIRWGKTNADRRIQVPVAELLQYIEAKDINHASILVSDVPGVIAYNSSNNLIATDMVTANRKLYSSMQKSDNALLYLMEYCTQKGQPITYYYYFGSDFIKHDKEGFGITYNDPKQYPELKAIGRYKLEGEPVFSSSDSSCKLWKLQ